MIFTRLIKRLSIVILIPVILFMSISAIAGRSGIGRQPMHDNPMTYVLDYLQLFPNNRVDFHDTCYYQYHDYGRNIYNYFTCIVEFEDHPYFEQVAYSGSDETVTIISFRFREGRVQLGYLVEILGRAQPVPHYGNSRYYTSRWIWSGWRHVAAFTDAPYRHNRHSNLFTPIYSIRFGVHSTDEVNQIIEYRETNDIACEC